MLDVISEFASDFNFTGMCEKQSESLFVLFLFRYFKMKFTRFRIRYKREISHFLISFVISFGCSLFLKAKDDICGLERNFSLRNKRNSTEKPVFLAFDSVDLFGRREEKRKIPEYFEIALDRQKRAFRNAIGQSEMPEGKLSGYFQRSRTEAAWHLWISRQDWEVSRAFRSRQTFQDPIASDLKQKDGTVNLVVSVSGRTHSLNRFIQNVSPFLGEDITLTFVLFQTEGDRSFEANLQIVRAAQDMDA